MPSAPKYTTFDVLRKECAPKKRNFMVKNFQKESKNFFSICFFKILPAKKIWLKQGLFSALGELENSNLVEIKKRSTKFQIFFKNAPPPPPLENFLDPRLDQLQSIFFSQLNYHILSQPSQTITAIINYRKSYLKLEIKNNRF